MSRYPIGRDCEKPEALTAEKRSLPRAGAWTAVTSPHQRISLRVPPGVFKVSDNARRLLLTGSDATPSMATGGDPRPFSIAVQRVAKGADVIASDPQRTKLLLGPFYDLAYELRGDDSPLPPIDENEVQGWSGARVDLLGHTAYVAVNGIEGDNSDYVVVPISDKDTLLVTADWSSTFNFGQPMCFERRIIAGVIESIAPKGP